MTEDRITAIVVEAQLRADRRGEAQRVYSAYGALAIQPAAEPCSRETIAIVHPATAYADTDAPAQAEPPAGLLL